MTGIVEKKEKMTWFSKLPTFFWGKVLLGKWYSRIFFGHYFMRQVTPKEWGIPQNKWVLPNLMTCQKFRSVSGGNPVTHIFSSRSRQGITKMGPALCYHLVCPYFGIALDLGLYPTRKAHETYSLGITRKSVKKKRWDILKTEMSISLLGNTWPSVEEISQSIRHAANTLRNYCRWFPYLLLKKRPEFGYLH